MILHTEHYPDGKLLHVIVTNLGFSHLHNMGFYEKSNEAPHTVTYLRYEFDIATGQYKIQFKLDWETPVFVFPPFWYWWRPGKHTTQKHSQTCWVHERDIIFYEFYTRECKQ